MGPVSGPFERLNTKIANIVGNSDKTKTDKEIDDEGNNLGDLVADPAGGIASCPTVFRSDPMEEFRRQEEIFIKSGVFEKLEKAGVKVSSVLDLSKDTFFGTAGTSNTMHCMPGMGGTIPSVSMGVHYTDEFKAKLHFAFRSSKHNLEGVIAKMQKRRGINKQESQKIVNQMQDMVVDDLYNAYCFMLDAIAA